MGSHRKLIKDGSESERKKLADRWVAVYKKVLEAGSMKQMSVKDAFLEKMEKKFDI